MPDLPCRIPQPSRWSTPQYSKQTEHAKAGSWTSHTLSSHDQTPPDWHATGTTTIPGSVGHGGQGCIQALRRVGSLPNHLFHHHSLMQRFRAVRTLASRDEACPSRCISIPYCELPLPAIFYAVLRLPPLPPSRSLTFIRLEGASNLKMSF